MNLKGILVVGSIVTIIALVVIIQNNAKNTPPGLSDNPIMNDTVLLNSSIQPSENLGLKDNYTIEKSSDSEFYIDENGSKHYVIKADDDVNTTE